MLIMRTPNSLLVACLVLASLAGCGGGGGHRGSNSPALRKYRLVSAGGLTTTPQVLFEGPVISRGSGISPDGKTLVGHSISGDSGNPARPIGFLDGTLHDLGTLEGGSGGSAVDANTAGQIVGSSSISGGNSHAFLYESGAMQDLGTLGGLSSQARAINESGRIVGQSHVSGNTFHAFLYESGTMKDLGTLGGESSFAFGVNSIGQVVGASYMASNDPSDNHAFLYEDGTMKDLGTMGGRESWAADINDKGQITGGSALANGEQHAFILKSGTFRDLGTLGGTRSYGEHINASGEVVGRSTTAESTQERPFLYSGGKLRDVNDLLDASGAGWTILAANGIADDGSIAATARDKDGIAYAVLLKPIE